jgi:NitT/TauT family transport system substrate-binding protein
MKKINPTKITLRSIVFLLFAVLVIAFAGGCTKKESPLEKVSVRLKWFIDTADGGVFVAKEKGFFKENGIDATIYPGGFELDSIKLVTSGSGDFGIAGADTFLLARAKGLPIVAIASEFQKTPICFISKSESGIKTPQDFIGKKVGVKFASDAETVYRILMAKLNIDTKKIKEIPLKWDMTPFFTGQVDVLPGYVTNEPFIAQDKGYKINVIKVENFGLRFYGNIFFTTEKMIKEKPELVQKFVNALVKGFEYSINNRDEIVDIVVKSGEKLDRNQQLQVYDASKPYWIDANGHFGTMEMKTWEDMEKMLIATGILDKPANLEKAVEMQFIQKALK